MQRSTSILLLFALGACSPDPGPPSSTETAVEPAPPPNVLFVVWDTSRADRMSVHGYEKPTTPFLDEWAQGGRVFDDCIAVGSSTVPSHAGMFTGKLPSEHGANNSYPHLHNRHVTLAELFHVAGYRTYSFTENPHLGTEKNFVQGFDISEHPWDDDHKEAAFEILRNKINPKDKSSTLADKILEAERRAKEHGAEVDRTLGPWALKAAGELAESSLVEWLDDGDPDQPFFAFLNYMEAHRPFIPPEEYRRKFMTGDQVVQSYVADRSWTTMWSYTMGMHDYSPEDLEVMALTYDACIYELDQLFKGLIESLEERGYLDNTIVVLTGDHGEHLGEHHMLDHQYSLYQGLVHVPMILWYPPEVAPGRIDQPVQNYDVYPTLLSLAGLSAPAGLKSRAISLLDPDSSRQRVAEYPSPFQQGISAVLGRYKDGFDPTRYDRTLRALYDGDKKFIWGSDDRHELYDLALDPDETTDLAQRELELVQVLLIELDRVITSLIFFGEAGSLPPPRLEIDPAERSLIDQMLIDTGYAGLGDDDE
jgi:arylsulfatase A-like enzyme